MVNNVTNNWRLILNSLAIMAVVAVTVLFLGESAEVGTADNSYLPAMTMVYETDGPNVDGVQTREVHRLEYRSRSDWLDTVIESQDVPVRSGDFQGVFNNVGSYTRLQGRELTEYDVFTDSYRRETIEPNTNYVINAALVPHHLDLLKQQEDIEFSQTNTDVTVCYHDDCDENVEGLLYTRRGVERVFLTDPRWDILLRVGDSDFQVRELHIEAERP